MKIKSILAGLLVLAMVGVGWGQPAPSGIPRGTTRSDGSAHQNNDTLVWLTANGRWVAQAATSAGVQLQGSTPGTPQTGNINLSGTVIAGAEIVNGTITLVNGTNSVVLSVAAANYGLSVGYNTITASGYFTGGSNNSDTVLNEYGLVLGSTVLLGWRSAPSGAGDTYITRYGTSTLRISSDTTTGAATLIINSNVGIKATAFGTSADGVLGIATGTAPSTAPADMIQIYSSDVSAGQCVFSVMQEYAPYAGVGVASTHKIPVRFNGTTYYILATTVQ